MTCSDLDIIVVGSCNIDMHWFTNTLPKPGETILGKDFIQGYGGKGANEAIAASRLGAKVALIAMIGNDQNGKDYLKNLEANMVSTKYVQTSQDSITGMANITIDKSGQNTIIVIPGANWKLDPTMLNSILSTNHIISNGNINNNELNSSDYPDAKVLVTQREVQDIVVLNALKWAKGFCINKSSSNNETITLFNPSPITWDERATLLASGIFDFCDIVILNELEIGILLGQMDSSSDTNDDNLIENSKKALLSLMNILSRVKAIVLTLGRHGVLFCQRNPLYEFNYPNNAIKETNHSTITNSNNKNNKSNNTKYNAQAVQHVKPPMVEAIDTSGAGDSFLGALAYYVACYPNLELHQMINRACFISAQSVRRRGTQSSYPWRKELPNYLF